MADKYIIPSIAGESPESQNVWFSSLSNKKRSILLPLASPESSNMAPEEVEGNDDLLVIILVQLPARSIFRFRCVSKRWNSIIYTPFFFQTFYNIRKAQSRMIAYIQQTGKRINMLPVPPSNDHNIFSSNEFNLAFLNLSNGLLLCKNWHPPPMMQYHIINPLTNKSVLLPPNKVLKFPFMALACEENAGELVLSYKVIAAELQKGNVLEMETFSSKTCEWTTSKLTTTRSFSSIMTGYTLVVNGIIHWLTFCEHVVVYDSNQDKIEPSLQMIQLPNTGNLRPNGDLIPNGDVRLARSSRNDPLWLCANIRKRVKIWMLPNTGNHLAEKEWVLMHNISYQPLRAIIESKGGICYPNWWMDSHLYTLMAGLVPWKSPLVALLNIVYKGLIYHVNLESMTFEQVQFPLSKEGPTCYMFYPYTEPLCLSSYAL